MKKHISLIFIFFLTFNFVHGQLPGTEKNYTRADSLRGGLRPERTHFDVLKYNLYVDVNPEKKFISGKNKITFKVLNSLPVMQLDLFENMKIDSIVYQNKKLNYRREYDAVFIDLPEALKAGTISSLVFYYSGNPIVAENPPWDGGFIFTKDKNGKDWVSVAVQGTGASLWYPNKDTQSDEPEEAEIHVVTAPDLMNVSNGRLTGTQTLPDGRKVWSWKVVNPINNYNLILNIGDYAHFSDKYKDLDLDYYVLPYNLEKAKVHFEEVKDMMACFYDKFGEYPFKEDGYKLVEAPHLGMEHQSAVAYGNGYQKGYLGKDRSETGIGLKWDFIIIHESAHEWFGNSITAADIADMWIHEAFTTYAETVYIECQWGKKEAVDYLNGTKRTVVQNKKPIIGDYGVNQGGSGDMYSKGALMLHTIRTIVDNDKTWWNIMRKFNKEFKHKITNTEEVIDFFNRETKRDLTGVFNQYLRHTQLPTLLIKKDKGYIFYHWQVNEFKFDMPIDVVIKGKKQRLEASRYWQKLDKNLNVSDVRPDTRNFYINVKKL